MINVTVKVSFLDKPKGSSATPPTTFLFLQYSIVK
ncbi:protein of unknown function [Shinella sp. WSC3-e]|nr:hypothetical protein SHINE37_40001 [Rhizobiaceae bacterium]CAK7254704.1 protein of unknown function [Shinella sp. WSC3-e]CAK7258128.1 protein of unknown function [Shinella sp. WSC3-e]